MRIVSGRWTQGGNDMVALLLSIGLRNQGDKKKEEGGTDSVIFCVHRECLEPTAKNVETFLCRSFDSSGAGKVGGHPPDREADDYTNTNKNE